MSAHKKPISNSCSECGAQMPPDFDLKASGLSRPVCTKCLMQEAEDNREHFTEEDVERLEETVILDMRNPWLRIEHEESMSRKGLFQSIFKKK